MNGELDDLYKQVILDHNKNPRNFGTIENPSHFAQGLNPLCGDHIDLYLKVEDGIFKDIKFSGSGCAISKASASIMTTILKGRKIAEFGNYFDTFHHIVTAETEEELNPEELGKLAVFCGVREFPSRVKCASLAWHTLNSALKNDGKTVTTD